MKCPICGCSITRVSFHENIGDVYETVELHYKCANCKLYEYEWVYGVEGQYIGNKSFADGKKHPLYILWTRLLYKLRKVR